MARRTRSAKFLGTRHNREYFRAWTRARKLRVGLTLLLPIVACAWLLAHTIRGSSAPYSSGPLSSSHNMFGNNCEACHVNGKNLFGRVSFQKHVADSACLDCHNSPQHQAGEEFTPPCASCHTEHVGSTRLITVTDKQCVQCHRDLHVKTGAPKYDTVVKSFVDDHPEFRPLRKPRDPGTVALNHMAHMKAGIRGPQGNVQMQCQDCHRPAADAGQPWPYALADVAATKPAEQPVVQMVATALDPLPPSTGRAHMTPIKYETQCAACHQLQFDERINDLVPHGKPEIIHDFVVAKYRDYLRSHPDIWRETPRPVRRIPGLVPPPPAHSPEEWVTLRTAQAETLLWRKNCKLCHTIDNITSNQPKIRPANITVRWLPHSTFNHFAHQAIACDSCHSKARTSKETADILIPGIGTCRKCHHDEPTQIGAAGDNCSLCHQYHDWMKQKPGLKGKFTIEQLLTKKATAQPAGE